MSRVYVLILILCLLVTSVAIVSTRDDWGNLLSSIGMTSGMFSIGFDSVNSGGQDNAESSSYILADTVGELATGESVSSSFGILAGYRQLNNSYISITTAADLALPSLGGISSDQSTGDVSWTVTTDNSAGYELSVEAQTEPALASSDDSFEDYVPSGGTPDFSFTVSAGSSAFGFSPEGNDVTSAYRDNGVTCGVGSGDTANACWDGFATTTKTVSQSTASNQPTGTQTTLSIQAANGANHVQAAGNYSSVITVTAVTR